MKDLTVELEKLSKKLTTNVEKFIDTWKLSGNLLSAGIPPILETAARDLSAQVQDLVNTLPAHLTQGLQPLLGSINPSSLPQLLDQLQVTPFNPDAGTALLGVMSGQFPSMPSFTPLSNVAYIEGCFGSGVNASCIASGALGAFGTLQNMQAMLPGNVDQMLGRVFSNLDNPAALTGALPNQLLGPVMSMANSVVGAFGSGIGSALGSLANPQMLGSVFGNLSSVMGSVTSSVQNLMSGLSGALSGALGSLQDITGNVLGGFLDPANLLGGFDLNGVLAPGLDSLSIPEVGCFSCW